MHVPYIAAQEDLSNYISSDLRQPPHLYKCSKALVDTLILRQCTYCWLIPRYVKFEKNKPRSHLVVSSIAVSGCVIYAITSTLWLTMQAVRALSSTLIKENSHSLVSSYSASEE